MAGGYLLDTAGRTGVGGGRLTAAVFRARPFPSTLAPVSFANEVDEIARAARGDRHAQSALVHRHTPRVYALARRMLSDDMAAEDVVQETFIRAWKAMATWEPRARLATWLHRVALNQCYDQLRKRREIPMDEPPDHQDPALGPAAGMDQAERVARIEAEIAALPERQRAALVLCRLEGHTNIEAAEIMEVSVEALESLLARARRTLRMRLVKDAETAHDR